MHYGQSARADCVVSGCNELWLNCMLLVCYPSSNILILPSQFWQIRFESYWLHCKHTHFKVPNTGAFTVQWLLLYAVKAQTSLAVTSSVVTVSWFTSLLLCMHTNVVDFRVTYAKTVPSPMKLTSEIDKARTTFLGSTTTDHMITGVWRLTLTAYSNFKECIYKFMILTLTSPNSTWS